MFYSHTFLARKGPLGTVWCAAHLQHRLRKSHYISTNVPSTVERIMFPEVPIALRMSGHLLLGVVRIYSKQVDYLYEDCNEIRITINRVFTSVSVNLPDDATHAPFHSVTFPEKMDLDSLELDDYYKDWCEDSHLKSWEDITLTEQIPTGQDPYIVITFNEHDRGASDDNLASGSMPMDQDVSLQIEKDTADAFKDPQSPINQSGADRASNPPSAEKQRDPRHDFDFNISHSFDFNKSPILPDRAEPDTFLEEQINKDNNKEILEEEEEVIPDAHNSVSYNYEEGQSSRQQIHFDDSIPEFKLEHSPPPVPKPKAGKKRKLVFDKTTVLSNAQMKNNLDDTSDILRVKRNCPLSRLDIFRQTNRLQLRTERFDYEKASILGACPDLQGLYKDATFEKFRLVTTEETHQETNVASPSLPGPDNNNDIVIENIRNNENVSHMPPFSDVMPSAKEKGYSTPENSNAGLRSENMDTTGNLDSDMINSDAFYDKGFDFEQTGLSDIPETVALAGDLEFLEQDNDSPAGSLQGTPESGMFSKNQGTPVPELQQLSSRTRAVAQYYKRQSSETPIQGNSEEESSGDLSLNKILEGKPRKICARMFYETLVLKSHGLVDVHQENPYDDITLKVSPKLSKGQFSS